jgi:hypothetical protein
VRVNQARHEDAITKVFEFPGGEISRSTDRNDTAPIEMHVTVLDRRAAKR